MIRNTILLGILLTLLGTGTFALLGFDGEDVRLLLPAAFGVLFLLIGGVALQKESWQRMLVYGAVGVALIVFLGTVSAVLQALTMLSGGDVAQPAVAMEQAITALLCLGFIGRAIKVYVDVWRHYEPA